MARKQLLRAAIVFGFLSVGTLACPPPAPLTTQRVTNNGNLVDLPRRDVAVEPTLRQLDRQRRAGGTSMHVLVRLSAEQMRARGANEQLGRPLEATQRDTVVFVLSEPGIRALAADPRVEAFGPIPPESKAVARQRLDVPPAHARRQNKADYIVRFFSDTSLQQAQRSISMLGANAAPISESVFSTFRMLTITIAPRSVADVLHLDSVASVEFSAPPLVAFNQQTQQAIGVGVIQGAPLSLTGAGQTVGVWDDGAVECAHVDLNGRCQVRDGSTVWPGDRGRHPTHVAGTVAGAGTSIAAAEGMAPGAAIDSYDWTNDLAELQLAGALAATNHSYGEGIGCTWDATTAAWTGCGNNVGRFSAYLATARNFDTLATTAAFVVVRAAGNDMNDGVPPNNDCATGWQCILPDATGKNVVTVGATTWTAAGGHAIAAFSGVGPTQAGRVKPDLVSRGVGVRSSIPGAGLNQTAVMQGTSMATPSVSGTVALLRQLAATRNTTLTPTELRALLFGTADQAISNGRPDYRSGWGVIDANAAARALTRQEGCLITRTVTILRREDVRFCVPQDAARARVTAHWTDTAGAALNQDVDLVVIDPGGAEHRPWLLDPNNPAAAAMPAANGQTDTRNNTEQVSVQAPASGIWTARLTRADALVFVNNPVSLVVPACAPASDDFDSDGVNDCIDNCIDAANPDQRDMDHDGIGDVCDDDRDGDGVPNARDNCPDVPNPDQKDTDRDGKGDACDPDPDDDCAELGGRVDRCPLVACGFCPCKFDDLVHQAEDVIKACNFGRHIPHECMIDGCGGPLGDQLRGTPNDVLGRLGLGRAADGRVKLPNLQTDRIPDRFAHGGVGGGPIDLGGMCRFLGRDLGAIGKKITDREAFCKAAEARAKRDCVDGCPR